MSLPIAPSCERLGAAVVSGEFVRMRRLRDGASRFMRVHDIKLYGGMTAAEKAALRLFGSDEELETPRAAAHALRRRCASTRGNLLARGDKGRSRVIRRCLSNQPQKVPVGAPVG